MANSIDFTTLAVGALIGIGCRKQLRAAGRVAATTVASLAGVAAATAAQVAEEVQKTEKSAESTQAAGQQAQATGQTQAGN